VTNRDFALIRSFLFQCHLGKRAIIHALTQIMEYLTAFRLSYYQVTEKIFLPNDKSLAYIIYFTGLLTLFSIVNEPASQPKQQAHSFSESRSHSLPATRDSQISEVALAKDDRARVSRVR
jgi:hypothetical protein